MGQEVGVTPIQLIGARQLAVDALAGRPESPVTDDGSGGRATPREPYFVADLRPRQRRERQLRERGGGRLDEHRALLDGERAPRLRLWSEHGEQREAEQQQRSKRSHVPWVTATAQAGEC